MQTPTKEVDFSFFSVCCTVFNCSWQLMMFDKRQKSSVKHIHLVNDDGLYDWKAFYKVKIVFNHPLWMMVNLSIFVKCFEYLARYLKNPSEFQVHIMTSLSVPQGIP